MPAGKRTKGPAETCWECFGEASTFLRQLCARGAWWPQGLFDEWVDNDQDAAASFGRLAEAVHKHFPNVMPAHFV